MTDTFDQHDFDTTVIADFRANGGKVGGLLDGKPVLLLHHLGTRTGEERISPLVYFREGSRIFVFASGNGSDQNPGWYYNLLNRPRVMVELGTEAFEVTARVLTGAERDEYYAKQAAVQPQFVDYQRSAARTIPVLELVRD
ncbi:nitroreductase/quinone reductase family protein [Promicromonospora sp. NPDC019610]|uniref:nitroreductase/quinone reductase family protein n=1 Tax=Promicromonospora sp. NPDC019610 TaxID=3364405 RepID=UPI0037984167